MDKTIFSGLEDLGFENIEEIDLYTKKEEEIGNTQVKTEEEKIEEHLYEKQYTCPVCENTFKSKAVKTSSYRLEKRDSDLFNHYGLVNPYFYDVVLCNSCGYAAMQSDFNKIRSYQTPLVLQKVTTRWRGKNYPEVYDINVAIERYKLSLLNYVVMEAKASKKAFNCLKLAWMYRLLKDTQNEQLFLKQAIEGFCDAYTSEDFPIYGMDKPTIEYLIGELNRRIGNNEEAMKWFSRVITFSGTPQKVKDLARDQRDLIKQSETISKQEEDSDIDSLAVEKKQGFFGRFFK